MELDREALALFRECHKPYVFGGFGHVRNDELMAAQHEGRLHKAGEHVALIARVAASPSKVHDYMGRTWATNRGDVCVSALAVRNGRRADAVRLLNQTCGRGPAWVEIFEEDKDAKAVVTGSGFWYEYTKVAAGGELTGLYSRHLPSLIAGLQGKLHQAEHVSLKQIRQSFASKNICKAIAHEIEQAAPDWVQHYSPYNKRNSWTAVALRGFSKNDPGFIVKPVEMAVKWKRENPALMTAACVDTVMFDRFPMVRDLLARIPGQGFERVRFMRLTATTGELGRHADSTDKFAGVANGRIARFHVPIITNESVRFETWDYRGGHHETHMAAGDLYYFDQRLPHAVINPGQTERIHLVIDVICNERTRQMIAK